MPGQPWPVLGSTLATVVVAGVVGFGVTATVCWLSVVQAERQPRTLAAVVGAAYAVVTIGLWAGVRAVAHPAPFSADVGATVFWLALAALGAVVLAGGTTYVYARFRYVIAPFALFAATAFTWYVFLQTNGSTTALAVWGLVYVPVFVVGAVVLLAAEWGLRTVTRSSEARGPAA